MPTKFIPTLIPVESSAIKAVAYEDDACDLFVQFHSGNIYKYRNVSISVFNKFMEVESKGYFLNAFIKLEYDYERVI